MEVFDVLRAIFSVGLCLWVAASTGFAAELLLNGDFEDVVAEVGHSWDYADWDEAGDWASRPGEFGVNENNNGWPVASCSGGHGSYSPGLTTFWFGGGAPSGGAEATMTQTVDVGDDVEYTARLCVAGIVFCGGDPPPGNDSDNTVRLDLEFFDGTGGAGSSLGTDSSGDVPTDTGDVEKSIQLTGAPPAGTSSAAFTITLNTGPGVGWGDCGAVQYSVACHFASFDASAPEPPTSVGPWEIYR
jgi:hypothetical protein